MSNRELALKLATEFCVSHGTWDVLPTAQIFLDFLEEKPKISVPEFVVSKDPKSFMKKLFITTPYDGIIPFKTSEKQDRIFEFLTGYQNSIIKTKDRQAGLTTILSAYALWYCLFNSNKKVFIISENHSMAQYTIKNILEILSHSNIEYSMYDKYSITFKNGTKLFSRAASSDTLRGYSIDMLIVQDYKYISHKYCEDLWNSMWPAITSKEGKIIFGSFDGELSPFDNLLSQFPVLTV